MVNFFYDSPRISFYCISGKCFSYFSKILKNLNKEYALKRLISRKHKLIE